MKRRYRDVDISIRTTMKRDRDGDPVQFLLVRVRDRRTGRRAHWCGRARDWRYHVARLMQDLLRQADD